MAYIGNKPANKAVVASDLDPAVITGQTALAVAPADTDEFLISDAGTLKRIDASLVGGGGITMADQWRLTANLAGVTSQFITANLEQIDSSGQGTIGTAMSESSGVFTFPSTGIYLVGFSLYVYASASDGFVDAEIHVTTNNSAYAEVANATAGIFTNGSDTVGNSSLAQTLIDVTNTSNVKVKFYVDTLNTGTQVTGSTSATKTGFTFIRLGDT